MLKATISQPKPFSNELESKLERLKALRRPVTLGPLSFDSPLILAPMASICNAPFRLLMQDLGAGGTVSEFVSANGINHGNKRTREMLRLAHQERNVGIQIFGEDGVSMRDAAKVVEEYEPDFVDINMGCPVKKVVSKGGGSALLKDTKNLAPFLKTIKEGIQKPLTIKIRMGWDGDQVNADEIINIANDCGVDMVAIHGRTRTQQYTGQANWDYIEELAKTSPLPLIGNGDLHAPQVVHHRMNNTGCQALMIARGCLRNPFIFLESLDPDAFGVFNADDYWEVIERLHHYTCEHYENERIRLIQIRKLIVWFTAGFSNASYFREKAFKSKELSELMDYTQEFFKSQNGKRKFINYNEAFMTSGHG